MNDKLHIRATGLLVIDPSKQTDEQMKRDLDNFFQDADDEVRFKHLGNHEDSDEQ